MKTQLRISLITLSVFLTTMTTLLAGNPNPDSRIIRSRIYDVTPYHHQVVTHSIDPFSRNEFYISNGTIIRDPFHINIYEINGRDSMTIPVNNGNADAALKQQSSHLRPGTYRVELINPKGEVETVSLIRID